MGDCDVCEKVSPKGERSVSAYALLTRKTLHPPKNKQSSDVPVPVPLFSSTLALPPNHRGFDRFDRKDRGFGWGKIRGGGEQLF